MCRESCIFKFSVIYFWLYLTIYIAYVISLRPQTISIASLARSFLSDHKGHVSATFMMVCVRSDRLARLVVVEVIFVFNNSPKRSRLRHISSKINAHEMGSIFLSCPVLSSSLLSSLFFFFLYVLCVSEWLCKKRFLSVSPRSVCFL